MKPTKISIIGAGNVGSSIAYALILKNIPATIKLIDIDEKRCRGEILDLSDALAFCGSSNISSGTPKDAQESDIIIIAAGRNQKPGEDRIQLYNNNKKVITKIMETIRPVKNDGIIIMVTNPLDLLTFEVQKLSNLPHSHIFGTGTFLDTQRLRNILSQKLHIAEQSIHAYILGEHGDTQFPAWSCAYVAGIPIDSFPELDQETLKKIALEAKTRASEIISCKGATYWGIATTVATICRTIIFDQKRVTPLSVYLDTFDVCLSMPVVLGKNGIEKILEIPLSKLEKQQLALSAEFLKKLL